MKKKFAIDCSKLNILEKSGTHRFLVGFLNELTKNKNYQFTFFYKDFDSKLNQFPFINRGEVKILGNKPMYTQIQLLKELNNYDLFLFPWQTLPFLGFGSRAKKLAVIHDTGFSVKTKLFTFLTQLTSDKLFSVSFYTAKRLVRSSVVISEGVDDSVFYKIPNKDLKILKEKISVPEYFILSLGRIENRKNIYNNLRAFSRVHKFFPKLKYVYIGQFVESEEDVYSFIDSLKIPRENILFKKYISDYELNIFLNCMEFMVFTPLEEGFGLPVIEAYSVEKPVILSRIEALAEFKLSANQYVDSSNDSDIATTIINFLKKSDSMIYSRQYKRVLDKFSWKNSVDNFINNI